MIVQRSRSQARNEEILLSVSIKKRVNWVFQSILKAFEMLRAGSSNIKINTLKIKILVSLYLGGIERY